MPQQILSSPQVSTHLWRRASEHRRWFPAMRHVRYADHATQVFRIPEDLLSVVQTEQAPELGEPLGAHIGGKMTTLVTMYDTVSA